MIIHFFEGPMATHFVKKQELLIKLFHGAPIAKTFGMQLSYSPEGNAIFNLPYNSGLDHAMGGIHGGIYATMLDNAGWFTSAAHHDEECWVATAEMSLHLLAPARQTHLKSVGKIIKSGKRQDIAEMHLFDEKNNLLAHATGTFILITNQVLADGSENHV